MQSILMFLLALMFSESRDKMAQEKGLGCLPQSLPSLSSTIRALSAQNNYHLLSTYCMFALYQIFMYTVFHLSRHYNYYQTCFMMKVLGLRKVK